MNLKLDWIIQHPTFNTINRDFLPRIALDSKNNAYIIYNTSGGTISGGTNISSSFSNVIFKLSSSGTILWSKQIPEYNTNISIATTYGINIDSKDDIYISFTTSGGIISGGTNTGNNDIILLKLNNNGDVLWTKQNPLFNTTGLDIQPTSLQIDKQDNMVLSYVTNSTVSGGTNAGLRDVVIMKMNPSGNILWLKQNPIFNTNSGQFEPSITLDSSGNIYCAYEGYDIISGGTNYGLTDIILFKLDGSGNHIWNLQSPLLNTFSFDYAPSIIADNSNNIFLIYRTGGILSGGTFTSNDITTPRDIVVAKISSDGQVLWTKQSPLFNTSGYNTISQSSSMAVDTNNNLYYTWWTNGISFGGTKAGTEYIDADIVITKINNNGEHIWNFQSPIFNTTSTDYYSNLAIDTSNNIYVVFTSYGTVSGGTNIGNTLSEDIVVFKLTHIPKTITKKKTDIIVPYNALLNTTEGEKRANKIKIGDILIASSISTENKTCAYVFDVNVNIKKIITNKRIKYYKNNVLKEIIITKIRRVKYYTISINGKKNKCYVKKFLVNKHLTELIKK